MLSRFKRRPGRDVEWSGYHQISFIFALCFNIFIKKKTKKKLEALRPCLHRVRETGWWEGCRDGGLVIRKLECGSRCVMWLLAGTCQPTSTSSSSSTNNQEQPCTTEEGNTGRMDMCISMVVIWFWNIKTKKKTHTQRSGPVIWPCRDKVPDCYIYVGEQRQLRGFQLLPTQME